MARLILASSSPYRKKVLSKLGHPFETAVPDIDESPREQENPATLVERLAVEKARAVARHVDEGLIIGSDQVAVLDQHILGKPLGHQRATEQLLSCSGRTVTFLTGLALLNSQTGALQSSVEPFRVHFRTLDDARIERYLQADQPYQCAGSFKAEGLGISLFERLEGDDPNTLIGLPLIRLIRFLEREGLSLP